VNRTANLYDGGKYYAACAETIFNYKFCCKTKGIFMKKEWFDNEEFWNETMPVLFHGSRLEKTPDEVSSIIALAGTKSGSVVLDMCCGIGRHSLEFARRGFCVTGVDRTEKYLSRAMKNAARERLKIETVRCDMREFVRKNTYSLAVNLFTSFGYFEEAGDDLRVARNICASLKKGGRFVVEMMGKEILARIFRERDWSEVDSMRVMESRKIVGDWEAVESEWTIIRGGEILKHKFRTRLYSAAELKRLTLDAGFSSASAYGALDGSPYDHNAKRLVVVAVK